MRDREFSAKVKQAAWSRADGFCECGCGTAFGPATGVEYDHIIPHDLGGDASLDNCRAITMACHRTKTREEDLPRITKARRLRKKAANVTGRKSLLLGSKGSGLRKRMDGTVWRE